MEKGMLEGSDNRCSFPIDFIPPGSTKDEFNAFLQSEGSRDLLWNHLEKSLRAAPSQILVPAFYGEKVRTQEHYKKVITVHAVTHAIDEWKKRKETMN